MPHVYVFNLLPIITTSRHTRPLGGSLRVLSARWLDVTSQYYGGMKDCTLSNGFQNGGFPAYRKPASRSIASFEVPAQVATKAGCYNKGRV